MASPRGVAGKSEIKGLDWRTGSPPLFETIGVFSGLATRGQPPPGHKKDRGPICMGTAAQIENLHPSSTSLDDAAQARRDRWQELGVTGDELDLEFTAGMTHLHALGRVRAASSFPSSARVG